MYASDDIDFFLNNYNLCKQEPLTNREAFDFLKNKCKKQVSNP